MQRNKLAALTGFRGIRSSLSLGAAALALAATLAATPASAGDRTAGFDLPVASRIGGVDLAPGRYKLVHAGSGASLEVKIQKGKRVLLTAPARMLDLDSAAPRDTVRVAAAADGTYFLTEIRFRGEKQAIRFEENAAAATSPAAAGKSASSTAGDAKPIR